MTPELALRNLAIYSAQIALFTLAAAVLPWAFRLRAPRGQLAFWYVVLVASILLPLVQPWSQPPVQAAGAVTAITIGFIPGDGSDKGGGFSWPFGWAATALLALGAGAALRLFLLALGILKLWRLRHHAEPVERVASIGRAVRAAGVDASFLSLDEIAGPVTFGVRNPVVLVPRGFFDLEPVEQESVALHELLHVRRRDWLYTLAEECVRAILWFHPAIWFLLNRVQLAREQSVDEAVVRSTSCAQEYVGALLKIAAARIEPDLAPAPLFLKKRLEADRALDASLLGVRRVAGRYLGDQVHGLDIPSDADAVLVRRHAAWHGGGGSV